MLHLCICLVEQKQIYIVDVEIGFVEGVFDHFRDPFRRIFVNFAAIHMEIARTIDVFFVRRPEINYAVVVHRV